MRDVFNALTSQEDYNAWYTKIANGDALARRLGLSILGFNPSARLRGSDGLLHNPRCREGRPTIGFGARHEYSMPFQVPHV